ncbi:unnamed protein product [Arctia plantaginis]|uniref:Uncharacterized protein n=1 Tax=Arctia plantaginis TaxID=874455 RepID=A0A8S0Z1E8_ARCPL|nr:unnamed protein product [Arctia plantaginis]
MYFFMHLCLTNNKLRLPIERKGIPGFDFHDMALSRDDFFGDARDFKYKIDFAMQKTGIEADSASFAGNKEKEMLMASDHEKLKLIMSDEFVSDVKIIVAPPQDIKKITNKDEAKDGFMRATDLPEVIIAAMHTGLGIIRNTVRLPNVFMNCVMAFGDFEKNHIKPAEIDAFDYQDPTLAKVTIFDINNEDQRMDMNFVDIAIAAALRTQWWHFRRNSA